jgi:hypothetical protein
MSWIYNGTDISSDVHIQAISESRAFVYCITNCLSNKRYFGKKRLFFTSHKRLKRRKNRIKVVVDSDWKEYWGSSDKLKADIEKFGKENFKREILRFCKSLSESSYYEIKYQLENDVLLYPDKFYNEYVGCRISRRQMGVKSA